MELELATIEDIWHELEKRQPDKGFIFVAEIRDDYKIIVRRLNVLEISQICVQLISTAVTESVGGEQ